MPRLRQTIFGLIAAAAFVPTLGVAAPAVDAQAFGRLYADAVNSDAGIDRFLERDIEQVPPEAIRFFFTDKRWVSAGGVDLIGARLRPGTPVVVEAAVRDRLYGAVQGVELTLKSAEDPRITAFEPTPAPAWALPPLAPITQAQLSANVAVLVDKGCSAGLFSGAVLVAAGDKVLVEKACGEASRRYHVANKPTTRINHRLDGQDVHRGCGDAAGRGRQDRAGRAAGPLPG